MKNIMRFLSISSGVLYFLCSAAISQEKQLQQQDTINKLITQENIKTEELKEVFISATKTEREFSSLPIPVELITKEQIKSTNAIKLSDVLKEQTGLSIVSGRSGTEGLQLQGLDGKFVMILVDGVPFAGNSKSATDLKKISVKNIKQIEIVKGASSSLYGSSALAGVINIITDSPKKDFAANMDYRLNLVNSNDFSTTVDFKKNKLSNSTSFNKFENVFRDPSALKNYTISNKTRFIFSEKTALVGSMRFFHHNDKIVYPSMTMDTKSNDWNAFLKIRHDFKEKWIAYLDLYGSQYKTNTFSYISGESESVQMDNSNYFLAIPELKVDFKLNDKHMFTSGLGLNHERVKRSDFFKSPKSNSRYGYFQYDAYPIKDLNVILGARFDAHDAYKSQLSPKIAVGYKFDDKFSIKSSVGYGFKAPNFQQLYVNNTNQITENFAATVLGYNTVKHRIPELRKLGVELLDIPISDFDIPLKPESSIGYNLGLTVKSIPVLKLKKLDVSFFKNEITNLIAIRQIARANANQKMHVVHSYYNLNRIYTQGMEMNSNFMITKDLSVSMGYQLLFAKDRDTEEEIRKGEVKVIDTDKGLNFTLKEEDYFGLMNRSRHTLNFKMFFKIPKWQANANLRMVYRSKFLIRDSNTNGVMDNYDNFIKGYPLFFTSFNKTFYEKFELGVGIDNVFNFKLPKERILYIIERTFYVRFSIDI